MQKDQTISKCLSAYHGLDRIRLQVRLGFKTLTPKQSNRIHRWNFSMGWYPNGGLKNTIVYFVVVWCWDVLQDGACPAWSCSQLRPLRGPPEERKATGSWGSALNAAIACGCFSTCFFDAKIKVSTRCSSGLDIAHGNDS